MNVALNGSAQLTATVTPVGSSGTPTGTVSFIFKGTSLGATTLSNSGTASVTVYGSQLPTGSDVITANYSGSNSFNASTGSVTINVSVPSGSSAVIPTANPNPVYQQKTDADGYSWFLTLRLTEVAGVSTSFTGFSFNGGDYSSAITSFFGSSSIPARGTLSAAVRIKALTVPTVGMFGFSGVDGSGTHWSQQLSVPFFGLQQTASMQLVGLPGTVVQNRGASDPTCQWLQNIGLQEQNGHTVYLTRFLAGGYDLSDSIADFFGDSILPGFGSLLGGVCWDLNSTPQTLSYEVDGIDDLGNAIVATQSTLFTGPSPTPSGLTVSQDHLLFTSVNSVQSGSGQINVNISRSLQWTVSAFPSNKTTSWLVVSPLSGTGPGTVNVVTNPSGLQDGVYQATLVFQSVDGIPQFINVPITLVVGKPNVTTVINGASLVPTGLSPGLIFTLKGTGLGPQAGQTLQLDDNGNVATELAGVQVLVAGTPAPLLYVQAGQINAVAPYEIANRVSAPVSVQVISNGVTGNVVGEIGARSAPAIFPLGGGQGAIVNQNGTVNGPGNPAAKGSIVSIYATGEGQTNPPGIDGRIANDSLANLPRPVAPFSISIGGVQQAVYTYAGTTPQSFAGFFQVNAVIPSNVPSGPNAVILTVGDASSPPLNVVVK
jgi:uncharacterized protein (TIGR03437 family)